MSDYVCTNCYHVGNGKMSGSILLELALWIICFPIGIWYSFSRGKHRHGDCPRCKGSKAMIPVATPRGQELLQRAVQLMPATAPSGVANSASMPFQVQQKPKSNTLLWLALGFSVLLICGILVK